MITSAGIYGFLSSAYQDTANKVENSDKSTLVITKKRDMLQKQLDQAEKQLELKSNRQNTLSDMRNRQQTNADNLIASNKSASSVRSQMNQLTKESSLLDADIKVLQDSIASKTQQISALETDVLAITTNSDLANEIGPLKYIAKLTGKTLDEVVNWFIIALMLVFDPLAIALVVAANFVFSYISDKKKEVDDFEAWKIEKERLRIEEEELERARIEAERIAAEELERIQEEERIAAEEAERIRIEERIAAEELERIRIEEEAAEALRIAEEEEMIKEYERILAEEEEARSILADLEEAKLLEEEALVQNNPFVIGGTPVKSVEEFSEEAKYFESDYTEDQADYVQEIGSSDNQEDLTEDEEKSEETNEESETESEEDGEFAGYKLGNVYQKKSSNIKDYENMKDVPIDILVTKGDPTRL
jgi:hypothetical protein